MWMAYLNDAGFSLREMSLSNKFHSCGPLYLKDFLLSSSFTLVHEVSLHMHVSCFDCVGLSPFSTAVAILQTLDH